MKKFGIIGNQCAGKTTVANMLASENEPFEIVKFADPIYDALSALGQVKKRGFMQDYSDIAKYYFGDDIFARCFQRSLNLVQNAKMIICDDCRYPFEFDILKKNDFVTVGVLASSHIRNKRACKQGIDFLENHSSEQFVDELIESCDYIIYNDGSDSYNIKYLVDQILKEEGVIS